MRTINLFILFFLFVLFSCNSTEKREVQKVSFGIYETVKLKEIPNSIIETLKLTDFQSENDSQSPIIGYLHRSDSSGFQIDLSAENFKLSRTANTVDNEGEYYAIVALKPNPAITNSDIEKVKSNGNNVEIYFNIMGARKWADLTKNSIGSKVAFTIDGQVYSLPLINAEIKNGIALLSGLENETIAKKISESLNSNSSD